MAKLYEILNEQYQSVGIEADYNVALARVNDLQKQYAEKFYIIELIVVHATP